MLNKERLLKDLKLLRDYDERKGNLPSFLTLKTLIEEIESGYYDKNE